MDNSSKVIIALALADVAYKNRERREPGTTQRDLSGANGAFWCGVSHTMYRIRQFFVLAAALCGIIITVFGVALCSDWSNIDTFQAVVGIFFSCAGPFMFISCLMISYSYGLIIKGVDFNNIEGSLERIGTPWAERKLARIRKAKDGQQSVPIYNFTERKPSIFTRDLLPQHKSKKLVKRTEVKSIERFDKVALAPKRDKKIRECIFGVIVVFVISIWIII